MGVRRFNNVTSAGTLTAPVTSSDASMTVAGFANYPAAPFTVTIGRGAVDEEVVLVTAANAGVLSVTRGFDGTAAQAHAAGAAVEHTSVAADFREANEHVNGTGGHGVLGDVVGTEGPQTVLDKTLISSLHEADADLGDAVVAYVPAGAEARNLFRGMAPDGDDVAVVDSAGNATFAGHSVSGMDTRLATAEGKVNAATAAPTASAVVARDAAGRAQVAAPAAAADIARKDTVDTAVAGAGVSAATANTVMRRDAAGRAQVAAPAAAADIATKGYVDGKGTRGAAFTGTAAFTVTSGWSLTEAVVRDMGYGFAMAYLDFVRTGATISPSSSGNIANAQVATIRSGFAPLESVPATSGAAGPVASGYLSASGALTLTAVAPNFQIATGTGVSLGVPLYAH